MKDSRIHVEADVLCHEDGTPCSIVLTINGEPACVVPVEPEWLEPKSKPEVET